MGFNSGFKGLNILLKIVLNIYIDGGYMNKH